MSDPQSMEPLDLPTRPDTASDLRLEMDATRARMADTLAALDERVREPIAAARAQMPSLDVGRFIQEQPLAAAGIALGAGLFLALTGADRAAAHGAVNLAGEATDAVRERLEDRWEVPPSDASGAAGADDAPDPTASGERSALASALGGPVRRLGHLVGQRIERELTITLLAMRAEARRARDG